MSKLGDRRLLKLADFLDTLPQKLFDYSEICYIPAGGKAMGAALKVGGGCGTVGCAIGWMPAAFPRSLTWSSEDETPSGGQLPSVIFKRDAGEEYPDHDFDVAREFFDIGEDESMFLFQPGTDDTWSQLPRDATARVVAAHIRKFVAERQVPA